MKAITFETDRFNLSEEKSNFINPCCFGEDLAAWLKVRLEKNEVSVLDVYQEDWGWEMKCAYRGNSYYLSLSGFSEGQDSNFGEWRIIYTKIRSFLQSVLGQNKLSDDEPIFSVVDDIFTKENIEVVHEHL